MSIKLELSFNKSKNQRNLLNISFFHMWIFRARVLKVHNTVPFMIHHDTSHPEHPSVLKKFRNRRKLPRLVVSIFNPEQNLNHQICTLPTSLIGPVCSIPVLSLYREITADDLLERPSSDSTQRITSPYLATFSRIFNEVDFADVLRV
ncbi:Nephrocystin-1, partial [Stegodyphus mimosarum]